MSLERYGIRWNGPHEPTATPMDDGYWTPWHIADAEIACLNNKLNADSQNFQIECQKAEIAALLERCGRLANEVMARRRAEADKSWPGLYTQANNSATIRERREAVDAHNDLAPAAGEAQEKTDGT